MTIYIRTKDLDKWKSLKNKSSMVSYMLNHDIWEKQLQAHVREHIKHHNEPDFHLDVKAGQTTVATKIIKTPEDAKKVAEELPGYISKSFSARKRK